MAVNAAPTPLLDVLIVVDGAANGVEERAFVASGIEGLVATFDAADVPLDVHFGIVSADIGVGPAGLTMPPRGTAPSMPGCTELGEEGALRVAPGCDALPDRVVAYRRGDPVALVAQTLRCRIEAETSCPFQQQDLAAYLALAPSTVPHLTGRLGQADRANAGFRRDGATTLVLFIRINPDCSVYDPEFFLEDGTYAEIPLVDRCRLIFSAPVLPIFPARDMAAHFRGIGIEPPNTIGGAIAGFSFGTSPPPQDPHAAWFSSARDGCSSSDGRAAEGGGVGALLLEIADRWTFGTPCEPDSEAVWARIATRALDALDRCVPAEVATRADSCELIARVPSGTSCPAGSRPLRDEEATVACVVDRSGWTLSDDPSCAHLADGGALTATGALWADADLSFECSIPCAVDADCRVEVIGSLTDSHPQCVDGVCQKDCRSGCPLGYTCAVEPGESSTCQPISCGP